MKHRRLFTSPTSLAACPLATRRFRAERLGSTLGEVVMAAMIMTVLMSLTISAVITLLRVDRAGRDSRAQIATLGTLAAQFRRDAHRAVALAPAPKPNPARLIGFELPGGEQVAYSLRPGKLDRKLTKGGQLSHWETYTLPPPGKAGVTVDDGASGWVTLSVWRGGDEEKPRCLFRVEALLRRDSRFVDKPSPE